MGARERSDVYYVPRVQNIGHPLNHLNDSEGALALAEFCQCERGLILWVRKKSEKENKVLAKMDLQ